MVKRLGNITYTDLIPLSKVYDQIKQDAGSEDALLTSLLDAACRYLEDEYGFIMAEIACRVMLDTWPSGKYRFEVAPLGSVTSVTYVDGDGANQTLTSSDYSVNSDEYPGAIHFTNCPDLKNQLGAVTINFDAGFASTELPVPIVQAVLMMVATMYELRQNEVTARTISKVETSTHMLLSPYKVSVFR
ncbi:MAG: hypothetical protein MK081_13955 [Flavobacteriales bacterium]|nr:hypothetical protein [Flavobacteriales bacterium]